MLINVKMATFINMVNAQFKGSKARTVFIFQHFSFYEHLKFHAQLIRACKKFYNLGAGSFLKLNII